MSYFNYNNKKVYYEISGVGQPLVLLHGDAASSNMFELIKPLYQEHFKLILIDFLGNGKSERVDSLPANLWQEQALQTIALLDKLQLSKVNLVGTSGGAWVAINVALQRPDLINKVVADSFDGRTLHENFIEDLLNERNQAKNDEAACLFYEWCQGDDWQEVVELNTKALIECARQEIPLFIKPLETLVNPILFIGSKVDEMISTNIENEYQEMNKLVQHGRIHLFENGNHPTLLSLADEVALIIIDFII